MMFRAQWFLLSSLAPLTLGLTALATGALGDYAQAPADRVAGVLPNDVHDQLVELLLLTALIHERPLSGPDRRLAAADRARGATSTSRGHQPTASQPERGIHPIGMTTGWQPRAYRGRALPLVSEQADM